MPPTVLPQFPAEFQLLLACARVQFDAAATGRARQASRDVRDWNQVLKLAGVHSISPLLYRNLSRAGADVPAHVMLEFEQRSTVIAARSLLLTAELLQVMALLRQADIAAIPYKGPTLALAAYGDAGLRDFADLDFLVRFADVLRARDVLQAAGWHPEYQLNAEQEKRYLRYTCEYNFYRSPELMLELHWEIVPPHFSISFDTEGLRARAGAMTVGGCRVPTLGGEDLVLVLCVHGAKHLWRSLHWLCDIAEAIRTQEPLDWECLLRRATQMGAARILLAGLVLARKLLDAPVPDRVANCSDSQVHEIAACVARELVAASGGRSRVRDHLMLLRARERWRDRVRYIWRVGTAPRNTWQASRPSGTVAASPASISNTPR